MMATKKTESFAADEAELAALDRRLIELRAREREVQEIYLKLDKVANHTAASSDQDAAKELLAGAPFVATRERRMSPLDAIMAEKKTLADAIKLGDARRYVLGTERSARIWASFSAETTEIEKRRMMLVFELQRTNRAREALREKIQKAGGAGYLSTDGVEFLGFGDEYAEIQWAANRLIADGIATKAEIEKVRKDV